MLISWSKARPELAGKELFSLARDCFCCPVEQAAEQLQPAGAIYFAMDEADVQRVISFPVRGAHREHRHSGLPPALLFAWRWWPGLELW